MNIIISNSCKFWAPCYNMKPRCTGTLNDQTSKTPKLLTTFQKYLFAKSTVSALRFVKLAPSTPAFSKSTTKYSEKIQKHGSIRIKFESKFSLFRRKIGSPDTGCSANAMGHYSRSDYRCDKGNFVNAFLNEMAKYMTFFISVIVILLSRTMLLQHAL